MVVQNINTGQLRNFFRYFMLKSRRSYSAAKGTEKFNTKLETVYYKESCRPCSVINIRNTKECGTFRAVQYILQGPYTVKKKYGKFGKDRVQSHI